MFNWADYTVIAVVAFSGLMSLIRGFVREALSLATWIIAIWIGIKYATIMGGVLAPYIKSVSLRTPVGFTVLFIAVLIIGALINFIIGTVVDKTGLGPTDRVIGTVFGVARGILLVAVLLLLAQMTPMPDNQWWKDSALIPKFQPLEDWLKSLIPKSMMGNHFELTTKD